MGSISAPSYNSVTEPVIRSICYPRHGSISDLFLFESLFQNGEKGVIIDSSDPSNFFQDVEGTVPVTSDGDKIALIVGENGFNLVQSDSALQPTYTVSGDTAYLSGDADTVMNFSEAIMVETMVETDTTSDVTTSEPSTEMDSVSLEGETEAMIVVDVPLLDSEVTITTGLLGL